MDVELERVDEIDLTFRNDRDFEEILVDESELPHKIQFLGSDGSVVAQLTCVEDGPKHGYEDDRGHYYHTLPTWLDRYMAMWKASKVELMQT